MITTQGEPTYVEPHDAGPGEPEMNMLGKLIMTFGAAVFGIGGFIWVIWVFAEKGIGWGLLALFIGEPIIWYIGSLISMLLAFLVQNVKRAVIGFSVIGIAVVGIAQAASGSADGSGNVDEDDTRALCNEGAIVTTRLLSQVNSSSTPSAVLSAFQRAATDVADARMEYNDADTRVEGHMADLSSHLTAISLAIAYSDGATYYSKVGEMEATIEHLRGMCHD